MSFDFTDSQFALGADDVAEVARTRLTPGPSDRIFHPARGRAMAEAEAEYR